MLMAAPLYGSIWAQLLLLDTSSTVPGGWRGQQACRSSDCCRSKLDLYSISSVPWDDAVQLFASSCHATVLQAAPTSLQPRLVHLNGVPIKPTAYFADPGLLWLLALAFAEDSAPGRLAMQQLANTELHGIAGCVLGFTRRFCQACSAASGKAKQIEAVESAVSPDARDCFSFDAIATMIIQCAFKPAGRHLPVRITGGRLNPRSKALLPPRTAMHGPRMFHQFRKSMFKLLGQQNPGMLC